MVDTISNAGKAILTAYNSYKKSNFTPPELRKLADQIEQLIRELANNA